MGKKKKMGQGSTCVTPIVKWNYFLSAVEQSQDRAMTKGCQLIIIGGANGER